MTEIRVVTFDLDDTLWRVEPVLRAAESRLRGWLHRNAPRAAALDPERLAAIRARVLQRQPQLAHTVSGLRLEMLRLMFEAADYDAGQASRMAQRAFAMFLEARHEVTLFDDVVPMLDALRRRYRLGVIYNGNADVRKLAIGGYFEFTICADDVGVSKPAPEIFARGIAAARCAAAEIVHVGDAHDKDVLGARAAGMRAIWVNFAGAPWPHDAPVPATVRSLDELPAAVHRLHGADD